MVFTQGHKSRPEQPSLWVHAVTWLLAVAAAVIVAWLLAWTRFFPYRPCWACRGRKGRGLGSTAKAYSRCRRCAGSGERVRPLSRIWPRHNAEAKRRRAEIKRGREERR